MNTIFPVMLCASLGALAGLVFHRVMRRFWLAAICAAILGSAVWIIGAYLFLLITAPNELGAPVLKPILFVFLTCSIPGLIVGIVIRRKKKEH